MPAGRDRRLKAIQRRLTATSEKIADLAGTGARVAVVAIPDGLDLTSTKGRAWLAVALPDAPVAALPDLMTEASWLARFAPR